MNSFKRTATAEPFRLLAVLTFLRGGAHFLGFFLLILMAMTMIGGIGMAAEPPSVPSDTSGGRSPPLLDNPESDFLKLPSFDLGPVSERGNGIRVGDILNFKIEIPAELDGIKDPQVELDLVLPPSQSNEQSLQEEGWEIRKGKAPDKSKDNEGVKSEATFYFELIPLKPGKLTLPSLGLKDVPRSTFIGRTNPYTLDVGSSIASNDPKPEEPETLEPPVGLDFPYWVIVAAAIVGGLLALGLIYGIVRWQKRRKYLRPSLPEIQLSEDEVALRELSELEKRQLIQSGQFKIFYFRLSEIIKNYLGKRYAFDATESTSREILLFLESHQLASDVLLDRLEALFERLDHVKFTDYIPQLPEPLDVFAEAKEWIQMTRKAPTVLNNNKEVDRSKNGVEDQNALK